MSLFQGAPSIHINNSAQDRLEEQEELEDQKRRNEEVKFILGLLNLNSNRVIYVILTYKYLPRILVETQTCQCF